MAGTLYRVELRKKAGTSLVGDDGVTPAPQPVSFALSGVVDRDIPVSAIITSFDPLSGTTTATATLSRGSHAGMYYHIEDTNSLVAPAV